MVEPASPRERPVAVAGLGSIGMRVARALDAGIPGLRLAAVSARALDRARQRTSDFAHRPKVVELKALAAEADIVVECLPPAEFRSIAEPILVGGALVAASVGALLANNDLPALAARAGGRIIVPSGALAGLDALAAAAEAGLQEVRLLTRKPPAGFGPEVETDDGRRMATEEITMPVRLFAGTARDAVRRFPKNVNVAATVSLAGLGPDRTIVEVWADPGVASNQHQLSVRSATGTVSVAAVNLPDPDNPKSSAVTGYSIVAALRRMTAHMAIGS